MTALAPLAVTMGEPAGIGGELTLKAWLARRHGTRPFFALDDAAHLASLAQRLGLGIDVREVSRPSDAARVFGDSLPVLPVKLPAAVRYGVPDPINASATIESIQWAERPAPP